MSLEKTVRENIKKYGAIFMKHSNNPVILEVIEGKTSFAGELEKFYEDQPIIRKKRKNDKPRFYAPDSLIDILKEFNGKNEWSIEPNANLSYDFVREEYRKKEKAYYKSVRHDSFLSIFSPLCLSGCVISLLMSRYLISTGLGLLTAFSYYHNIKALVRATRSDSEPSKPALISKLYHAAQKADKFIGYYYSYLALSEYKSERK
jgi:hypothetical protein